MSDTLNPVYVIYKGGAPWAVLRGSPEAIQTNLDMLAPGDAYRLVDESVRRLADAPAYDAAECTVVA
ncbi:hypothetical protein AEAC466_17410 [Asticcacaulis sp. AC466]|uniref:hypothetical protein n=1 Tax=Asticcacaulis sp. AC466 TaxID=1282362 RepID=UPI0003C40F49|nr:hypothetical protein [Asticcacaulis sp. AC466]ESQ82401.1 hypothetical protein AEAC466_17410 [Asticcacaulis sp. AC466]